MPAEYESDFEYFSKKYRIINNNVYCELIFYSFEFIIACFVFWFRNFSYAGWLSGELIKYSRKPDSIYKTYFNISSVSLVWSLAIS